MLISKYGFTDVLEPGLVVLDPSRVAAQIVTGVGFLGAGIIFVRGGSVRGLTTAAAIWVTAAIGSASGAGLPVLAVLTTRVYFVVVLASPMAPRRLPRSATAISALRVRYPDGRGILREVLREVRPVLGLCRSDPQLDRQAQPQKRDEPAQHAGGNVAR
jgi:putative Mg2+ transporter-C (MgtC) family protein